MAVNIGLYFLQREYPVQWLSRSTEQIEYIRNIINKTQKRNRRFFPNKIEPSAGICSLYESDIDQPDIIIESSRESLTEKKQIFSALSPLITNQTLLFSNSSSILPKNIHQRCLGAHFFFPTELTSLVELISCHPEKPNFYQQSLQFLSDAGFDVIEQDDKSAFLLNRLLLPLQAASFEALKQGVPPEDIETASKSDLISFGQLSLMDSIGLDIVRSAVVNYRSFSAHHASVDFNGLIAALDQLLAMGKLGAKNKNGLLIGDPLPWPTQENHKKLLHSSGKHFKQLLVDGCRNAIQQKTISKEQLFLVLDRLFQATNLPDNLFED